MRFNLYRILALLVAISLHGFAAAQDLLPPEVAFKFSAQALDANTLETLGIDPRDVMPVRGTDDRAEEGEKPR